MESFNSPSDNPYFEGESEDPDKDLRDLVPYMKTDGGVQFDTEKFKEIADAPHEFDSITDYGRVPPEGDVKETTPIEKLVEHFTTGGTPDFDEPTLEEMDEMVDKAISLVTEKQGVNKAGSENKLNKRSVLMNLHDDQRTDTFAYFEHFGDEDGVRLDGYYMPLEIWDDFGRPDTITVVVYPRDMFN